MSATMFVLIVFAYFVVKYDVSIVEKIVLMLLLGFVSLAPLAWADARVACAIVQGVLGVYVVLRMYYKRANEKRRIVWK
jgi:hypothetical protein